MKPVTAEPSSAERAEEDSEFELELARAVVRARKRRCWTQKHVAEKAKLSLRTIRQVEEGNGGRLRLAGGLRLLRLLGLRMRFIPTPTPNRRDCSRKKRLIERGTKYLAGLIGRLPPRKRLQLLCTPNEFEFLFEAVRLIVEEGW